MTQHRRREPAPGIFRLVLPLPFPGLDRVNAYLLDGGEGPTLVDCGIFDPEPSGDHGWGDLVGALDACGVAVGDISRLVITHPHIDHYGMAARLVDEVGCELWMHGSSEDELQMYEDPESVIARVREMFAEHGVESGEVDDLTAFEDWRSYLSGIVRPTHPLSGGEVLEASGRRWEIVHTPGHSRSHICLASDDRILISGDHLLPSITPHIDFRRGEDTDPLGEFLTSLQRIEKIDPLLVLPGHGRPFDEGAERARINQRHHDRRLGSILQIIRREPHTASEITDEIWGTTLLDFQRRLALGEALAHLAYLVRSGEVERLERDSTFYYKKADKSARA